MDNTTIELNADHAELTAEIVSAYVSNNRVQPSELPDLIFAVHAAVGGLGKPAGPEGPSFEKATPAQIKKSISHNALISFIDGKPYKTLKRHLGKHGLDLAGYRERYGLPVDYPSTAPGYSETRSALARSLGLGRKLTAQYEAPGAAPQADEGAVEAPKRRGRAKKAGAAE